MALVGSGAMGVGRVGSRATPESGGGRGGCGGGGGGGGPRVVAATDDGAQVEREGREDRHALESFAVHQKSLHP